MIYSTCATSPINLGIVSLQTDCSSLLNYLLTFLLSFHYSLPMKNHKTLKLLGFTTCIASKIAHFLQ